MEFFFEGSLHSVHDILYLGILQRVLCVLEDEGKGIGFLARFEVLALIYVEQIDVLEQFLLGRKSSACEVGEFNGFIHKECKVAFYLWILRQIVDDWSAQSGVKATINVVDWNSYWTLLEAGATGGELPDVFWMHSNVAQQYMENDMLLDLTDKIAASDKIDKGNYYQGIVNLYQSNGKQYAVPKDIDTIAL